MTANDSINLPIVQMGHVEQKVVKAQNQPHIQQLVAQQTIAEELKKLDSQIADVEKTKENRQVGEKQGHSKQHKQHSAGKEREGEEEPAPEEEQAQESPWVGNIVNVKI